MVFLVAIVTLFEFASHYQPVSIQAADTSQGLATARGTAPIEQVSALKNIGSFGVSVLVVRAGIVTNYPRSTRLTPSKFCSGGTAKYPDYSAQALTGSFVGAPFHAFGLSAGAKHSLPWFFDYNCRIGPPDNASGEMGVPVTYRLLWFTHTVKLIRTVYESRPC